MQKALVVRFGAIGDCVMCAWPVTGFKQAYPDCEITWIVSPRCAPVIAAPDLADHVEVLARDRRSGKGGASAWLSDYHTYRSLRRKRFDFGFDLQGLGKTALAVRIAAPRKQVSIRRKDISAKILIRRGSRYVEGMHQVEHLHEAMQMLAPFELPERPIMPPAIPVESLDGTLGDAPLLTIQTGGSMPEKVYPVDRWGRIIDEIPKDWQIVAIGGAGDPVIPDDRVIDLVGKLSLRETMEAVRRSALHIAGDTGTGHIAAAYGVPSVAIMGPLPKDRYRPFSNRSIALQNGDFAADVPENQIVEAVFQLVGRDGEALVR